MPESSSSDGPRPPKRLGDYECDPSLADRVIGDIAGVIRSYGIYEDESATVLAEDVLEGLLTGDNADELARLVENMSLARPNPAYKVDNA